MNILANDIANFYDDPYKFVMYVFPWGEKGTPLEHETGPDEWQTLVLKRLGEEIKKGAAHGIEEGIQVAITSGHGIGKTAFMAWLILWFISTRPHPQVIVTANTLMQLTTKTWRELAKWHKRAINKDWFEWTATKFYLKEHPETWFASAIPWSEHRSEAFAGAHEDHVLILFDESGGIPDIIWEVAEGAMSTPGAIWVAAGNPIKNTGRFRECFGKFRHRWIQFKIDSRTAKMYSKELANKLLADYGEDSDYFKVRVKGEFPSSSSLQFIGNDIVEACQKYEASNFQNMPYIMGVDVARFGDDQSVIYVRQGRKTHVILKYRGLDTMQLSHRISEIAQGFRPITIFIDGVGVGGGVVDYCKAIGMKVIEVNAGSSADAPERYANKRAEMWDRMREWLKDGAQIPSDCDLFQDLIGVEYGHTMKGQILLEKKEEMKRRGLSSPDVADALSLTFHSPVAVGGVNHVRTIVAKTDWNVF